MTPHTPTRCQRPPKAPPRAHALPRPIGSNAPAPIRAEPHLERRAKERARAEEWLTKEEAYRQVTSRDTRPVDEEQQGDVVASRILWGVIAVGMAAVAALSWWAYYALEVSRAAH